MGYARLSVNCQSAQKTKAPPEDGAFDSQPETLLQEVFFFDAFLAFFALAGAW